MQAKIDSLNADKQRLEKLKETLLRSIEETAAEVRVKDGRVKELQAKRAEKMAELDRVKADLEAKEQELGRLYKEISTYDDGFHSGNSKPPLKR